MEAQTEAHLRLARENSTLAATLTNADDDHAHGWSAVVAFYAAVHLVNAYLWEQQ